MTDNCKSSRVTSEVQTSISSLIILPSTEHFMNRIRQKRTYLQTKMEPCLEPTSFDFMSYSDQIFRKYQKLDHSDHILTSTLVSQTNKSSIPYTFDEYTEDHVLKCLKFLVQEFLRDATLFRHISDKFETQDFHQILPLLVNQAHIQGGPLLSNLFQDLAMSLANNSKMCPKSLNLTQMSTSAQTFEQVAGTLPNLTHQAKDAKNVYQVVLYQIIDHALHLLNGGADSIDSKNLEQQFSKKQRNNRKELKKKLSEHHDNDILIQAQDQKQDISRKRSTSYRGVTKNGLKNWQIMSNDGGTKCYFGTVDNIVKAALIYDLFTIQVKGLKAKTNFNYTKRELSAIMKLQSLLVIKDCAA